MAAVCGKSLVRRQRSDVHFPRGPKRPRTSRDIQTGTVRRVRVTSPKDPLVQALKQQVKEQNQGFIHILKPLRPHNGDPYSLIFAPVAGSGGALPARRFASLGDLEVFLGQNLHLKPSSILDAIHELKRDGASFVTLSRSRSVRRKKWA